MFHHLKQGWRNFRNIEQESWYIEHKEQLYLNQSCLILMLYMLMVACSVGIVILTLLQL